MIHWLLRIACCELYDINKHVINNFSGEITWTWMIHFCYHKGEFTIIATCQLKLLKDLHSHVSVKDLHMGNMPMKTSLKVFIFEKNKWMLQGNEILLQDKLCLAQVKTLEGSLPDMNMKPYYLVIYVWWFLNKLKI